MAKKFGKFLMVTAALGAVAAGAYYYLHSKDDLMDDEFDDDDDFDNFDEDLDEEDSSEQTDANRNYVDLDLKKSENEEFKEGLSAAKVEATDKVVGAAKEAAAKAENKVEEFFDDEDDNDGSMNAM